jgi:hypothetical protein
MGLGAAMRVQHSAYTYIVNLQYVDVYAQETVALGGTVKIDVAIPLSSHLDAVIRAQTHILALPFIGDNAHVPIGVPGIGIGFGLFLRAHW